MYNNPDPQARNKTSEMIQSTISIFNKCTNVQDKIELGHAIFEVQELFKNTDVDYGYPPEFDEKVQRMNRIRAILIDKLRHSINTLSQGTSIRG